MASFTAIPLMSASDAHRVEMIKTFVEGKPIYVRFTNKDQMRDGSIAIIKDWNVERGLAKNGEYLAKNPHWGRSRYHVPNVHQFEIGSDKYEVDLTDCGSFFGRVRWEGRKNECEASIYNVEWLKGYEGPCVWQFGKKEQPQVIATDRLGREIKVGDFCCYILHHFSNYGASTQFGTVTKIERDGTVWAKNIALGEDESAHTKKINDNSTIVILTKDLMDRLMMAKLSTL
jgi:hypothetical protein